MTLDDRLNTLVNKLFKADEDIRANRRPPSSGISLARKYHDQEKQAILSDLLELIGEDDIEVRGTTQNPDNPKHWTRKTANRNQLRQELRDKVKEYCE